MRTWRVKSLDEFSALSRRSVGRYAGKTSWGIVIIYFHSYLYQRSALAYNRNLNVRGQNLEVGKILKTRQLSYFLDSELNYEVNLKYFQRYIVHFIEFFKIEKIGA